MQLKATLRIQGWDDVLDPTFEATIPSTKKAVMDITVPDQKLKKKSREKNTKVLN